MIHQFVRSHSLRMHLLFCWKYVLLDIMNLFYLFIIFIGKMYTGW